MNKERVKTQMSFILNKYTVHISIYEIITLDRFHLFKFRLH